MKSRIIYILVIGLVFLTGIIGYSFSRRSATPRFAVEENIDYCRGQAMHTLLAIPSIDDIPNSIDPGSDRWNYTHVGSWTCGFWPGILWYLYEYTKDGAWKQQAGQLSDSLVRLGYRKAGSHDIGFIMMTGLGNGYRLTGNPIYKEAMLHAADSLAMLFNPTVGTILSWPGMVAKMNWPHNTIIDNMLNLELLFWAARNGGDARLYDIACSHANRTMHDLIRPDYTCYHVAVYDTIDGHFIKGVTHQGLNDDSMWARGQAWAIYGFTMAYRETHNPDYLLTACKTADVYLSRLPEDLVPYWDFNAPELSADQPKDASAAAITASALLELSTLVDNSATSDHYYDEAVRILESLSSKNYQSREKNSAFLLHSVGHMNNHSDVDASISYADYYYLEALIRLKRLEEDKNILANL